MNSPTLKVLAGGLFVFAVAAFASAGTGCGSKTSDDSQADASTEGGVCLPAGTACATSADCCSTNCEKICLDPVGGVGACKLAGESCSVPTDCCSVVCESGKCGGTLCTSDHQACTSDAECCGKKCGVAADAGTSGAKTCTPLNATCKTSGNRCAANGECCSKLCQNGVCNADPSFCTQLGDACSLDTECCGGLCTKAAGSTLGTCGVAAPGGGVPGCVPAGQACTNATTGDAGTSTGTIPTCGGDCCSRSCRPYAATGVLVCQPPSGCRPTGELCQSDKDCCGATGSAGSTNVSGGQSTDVHCEKAAGATVGRCDNGKACSPAGAICRLATTSCNATDRCCSGTVQQHPLDCKQDALGIPRCTAATDYDCAKGPPPAGTACASSADCCGNPCVPNPSGNPPFVCGSTACVPTGGACTTTADCCSGSPCTIPAGASKGTCGASGTPTPDSGTTTVGGTTCAQYGQVCTQTSDCCNGVPCNNGRCGQLIK